MNCAHAYRSAFQRRGQETHPPSRLLVSSDDSGYMSLCLYLSNVSSHCCCFCSERYEAARVSCSNLAPCLSFKLIRLQTAKRRPQPLAMWRAVLFFAHSFGSLMLCERLVARTMRSYNSRTTLCAAPDVLRRSLLLVPKGVGYELRLQCHCEQLCDTPTDRPKQQRQRNVNQAGSVLNARPERFDWTLARSRQALMSYCCSLIRPVCSSVCPGARERRGRPLVRRCRAHIAPKRAKQQSLSGPDCRAK